VRSAVNDHMINSGGTRKVRFALHRNTAITRPPSSLMISVKLKGVLLRLRLNEPAPHLRA
jgi:hypothetical protein